MMAGFRRFSFLKLNPAQSIVCGYLMYAVISAFILRQPFFHKIDIPVIDNFFTSVSAVTATGLVSLNVASSYTFWGQMFILILIQIGGIGYMTFSSFIIIATSKHVSLEKKKILSSSFSFPSDFCLKEFLYNIVVFSFIVEIIGAVVLSWLFMVRGVDNYIWSGVFHSVSAFCTAGFTIFENGFLSYSTDAVVSITLCILMLLGGIGFIVFFDLYKRLTGKRSQLTFTSKVIILITVALVSIGTVIFHVLEKPYEHLSDPQQILNSFFQVVSACTTGGFSTVNIAALQNVTLILLSFFMIFGASPSGTGGGIKNTTLAILLGLIRSTLRKREYVTLFETQIPEKRVQLATAVFSFYTFILFIGIFLVSYFENNSTFLTHDKLFLSFVFEVLSALGNIGFSMGITPDLTVSSKSLLIILMFISRIGILTFGFSLMPQDTSQKPSFQKKDLVL